MDKNNKHNHNFLWLVLTENSILRQTKKTNLFVSSSESQRVVTSVIDVNHGGFEQSNDSFTYIESLILAQDERWRRG
jgi:hypothetical protein